MKRLKKVFVLSVMFSMVLSLSVVAAPASAAASAGDLIKMDGLASVYYLGGDDKRYVFPNAQTYFSWYSDFSSIDVIPQDELESYGLGGNVTMRAGTKLVKITTNPKVYAVEPGGELVWVPSEEVAIALYGADWATRVVDVPDAFFTNYTVTSREVSATEYPDGSLVKFGTADIYYIEDGKARLITDEAAFEANGFNWSDVIESTLDMPAAGDDLDGEEFADTSEGAGGTAGAGTGVSAALAASTPASAIHPTGVTYGASMVPFTVFNFTAANDGDVTINRVTLTRTGLGDDDELGDVYLFDGNTRLTDGKSINSDDLVYFSGVDFEVPAGTTKALTVRVDLAANGADGNHAFAIMAASDIETDGAVISGSFPLSGNAMALSATDVAAVSFSLSTSVNGNVTVGEEAEAMLKVDLEELSGDEDVALYSIMFEQKGTISNSDLDNFELFDGGTLLGEGTVSGDYVTFTLDTPYIIEEGDTETLTVKADVEAGVDDTINFQIDEVYDITAIGQKYGYIAGVVASANAGDTFSVVGGELAIDEDDTNPSSQDVAKNTDNVVFLAAEFDAQDEAITVTDLDVVVNFTYASGATTTDDYLQDLALYLDGTLVAGPEDVDLNSNDSTVTVSFDDEFTVDGVQVLTVVADITDDSPVGVYNVEIAHGGIDAEDSEGDAVASGDITGTATGNSVNVGTDVADLNKDNTLGNRDIVAGDEDFLVGQFILEAGDSEGLYITEYEIDFTLATVTEDDLMDLYVGSESPISNPDTLDNTFSVNETLAAGESMVIPVYVTLDSDYALATGSVIAAITVTTEGMTSGDDADYTATGQTMSVANGTLELTVDASTPDGEAVVGGVTSEYDVATFEFAAENLGYEITEIEVTVFKADGSTEQEAAVTTLYLGTDSEPVINGVATFNTSIDVAKDDEVSVTFAADFNSIDNITADETVLLAITDYKYIADNESVEEEGVADNGYSPLDTDEVFYVYNTLLTVTSELANTSSLALGENDVMDITFTADAAEDVTITDFVITVTESSATVTVVNLLDSDDDIVATSSNGTFALTGSDVLEIGAGSSKTYTIEYVVTGPLTVDVSSVAARLVEAGFVWDDQEADDRDGSQTDTLPSDTYEVLR